MADAFPKSAAASSESPKLKIYFLPNLLTAGNLFCGKEDGPTDLSLFAKFINCLNEQLISTRAEAQIFPKFAIGIYHNCLVVQK